MKRREFLSALGAGTLVSLSPTLAMAAAAPVGRMDRLLILVELKGGNDGLNTIIPFSDDAYYALRPQLAVRADGMIKLDGKVAINKVLNPLMPMWSAGQMAILQGVGYPQANLSHFRSIEIWDTASKSDEYLPVGWLTRLFAAYPVPPQFTADAIVIGSADLGPVAGGARAIELDNPGQFSHQARLVQAMSSRGGGALAHILKVEDDVVRAAQSLGNGKTLKTEFPDHGFGHTCKTACETLANANGIAVARLTLTGFDTHQNQAGTQANLLTQLGEGLAALKTALVEMGRWDDTLILTYSEFGRRPKENESGGTDHGTVAPHFVLGGKVRGGLYGNTPSLAVLDESGNLPYQIDFRGVYASVLERWWNLPSQTVLGGKFALTQFV
ncbi:MAG TPA: DUF1501 domain-containing protein [Rhodocyclaceae bacterium]|nr:DUF1501 domain-containing protein [Rhodocyclaceae bacterium]